MRKDYLILLLLFFSGMWIAQLLGGEYFDTYGYLNVYHLKNFVGLELNYVDLFWNILWIRGKFFLTVCILKMTACRNYLSVWFLWLFAFLTGFFLMACCITVGASGLFVLLASIFPHGICYVIALIGILGYKREMVWAQKKNRKQMISRQGLCILWIVSGCLLETIVGTRLLRYVLEVSKL